MQIIDGIPVFGPPDEGALSQIKTCARTAARVALMADHHKGYAVPIGGVVAYEHADTVQILHTLEPLGVAMAGANEFDPYKD